MCGDWYLFLHRNLRYSIQDVSDFLELQIIRPTNDYIFAKLIKFEDYKPELEKIIQEGNQPCFGYPSLIYEDKIKFDNNLYSKN